jgi:hypothetical protein
MNHQDTKTPRKSGKIKERKREKERNPLRIEALAKVSEVPSLLLYGRLLRPAASQ